MSAIRDNKRKNHFYYENEPPDKKLISQGDLLIKELHAKQKNTKITLKEELLKPNTFEKATTYVPVTNLTSGTSDLRSFQHTSQQIEQIEHLKRAGLSCEDIRIYLDAKNDGRNLFETHKNIEPQLLKIRLENIHNTIKKFEEESTPVESDGGGGSRQQYECALSVKPDSIETKLLKFALTSRRGDEFKLPHPMDEIKQIEDDCNERISTTAPVDIRKIRKKARSLANKLKPPPLSPSGGKTPTDTKWDVQTPTIAQPVLVEPPKTYSCDRQNFYTVCNGEIVQLPPNTLTDTLINGPNKKLSPEQIRSLPRFQNYTIGTPNKSLFLKNLPRGITEEHLKVFFQKSNVEDYTDLRLMKGKMRGQAFVSFDDKERAACALKKVNGEYIGNKPVVVQYSRKINKLSCGSDG